MATVLIVDDTTANRLLIVTLLRPQGHVLHEAADGVEALRLAREHDPEVVVLDLSLPKMSGADFLKALRRQLRSNAEVVLYTGTQMNTAMRDFMELFSIRYVLPKPSEPQEVVRVVQAALAREPA